MEQTGLLHRKERIILAAIDEIDKHGIQAISTREIAKRQGVSESIIFKHFSKKADLLLAVLDHFSQYDNAIVETTHTKRMKPRDAITYFIDSFSTYYENYPAITAIDQSYDILRHDAELNGKIKSIFDNRTAFIQGQIEKAKQSGEICPETNSESLANIIMGTFREICLKWRMNGCDFPLRGRILNTIEMILDSFGLT